MLGKAPHTFLQPNANMAMWTPCCLYNLTGFCSLKHQRTRQRHQISRQPAASSITRAGFPTVIFLLSSDWSHPPLSRRMKDIFTENNTRVGPLVYRLQTRGGGGGRKRVNGQKEGKKRKRLHLCLFPSFIQLHITDGQLGMRSMRLYIGKEIKSRWEITFRAPKGCDEVSQLAFRRLENIKGGI